MTVVASDPIIIEAAAKINLYLHVVGRRASGYHDLDSLIAFVNVYDTLSFELSDELTLQIEGTFSSRILNSGENLVIRAAHALAAATGVKPTANIALKKELPVAAGLGSGSADAAATLRGLAKLWMIDTSEIDLKEVGFSLGADIPAGLVNDTVHVSGVGELLQQGPRLPNAGILLVNPGVTLSTPSVFKARRGGFSPSSPMVTPPRDMERFVRELEDRNNDLTEPAVGLAPVVREVLSALEATPGCRLARLSGSGATCFGLFDDPMAAELAAGSAELQNWWVRPTTFRTTSMEIAADNGLVT